MELSQILNALADDGTNTKTAADAHGAPTAEGTNPLTAALDSALAEVGSTKTASAATTPGTPTGDLTKIASRLASAEKEALVKEAELYGAAICDGFMARMGQYETDAGVGMGKVASSNEVVTEEAFSKFASENPTLVKQAMELGYRETRKQLEKVANDAYTEGYEKTAAAIKVAAEDCAQTGFEHANQILASL